MSEVNRDHLRYLPPGWLVVPLGQLASIQSGVAKNSRKNNSRAREVPYLRVANVQRGWLDLSEVKTMSVTPEKIEKTVLQKGDVLFNEGGDRDKLGRGWVWGGEIQECVHQNHVFRARLRSGVLPRYVSYFGNSWGRDYFLKSGKQTTNLASINKKILNGLPIRLAPLAEQHRIVATIETHFSRLGAAVASLERVRANLKRARASVLKAAVEGRLVPTEAELARQEGRSYEHASVLQERILKERRRRHDEAQVGAKRKKKYKPPIEPDVEGLPELPEGWVWARWDSLCERVTVGYVGPMKKEYRVEGVPFLRGGNVRANRFRPEGLLRISQEFHERISKSQIIPGDLLIVRSGAVGTTCVLPESVGEANCSDLVLVQRPAIIPHFGAYYMNSTAQTIIEEGKVGIALTHFNTKSVAALPVPIPPMAEQRRIVAEVESRLSVLDSIEQTVDQNLERCERLRQSILKRAFEGKLVPQDPNDEPASELLARIQAEGPA